MATMATVLEAASLLNRNPESVRKIIDERGIKKDYTPGKQRFRVTLDDVVSVYREIEAAGR
jgi:hypothetical protein